MSKYFFMAEWQKNTSRLHTFIPPPGPSPPGMTLIDFPGSD